MIDEHQAALEALMLALDRRLAAAPLVDRRRARQPELIEASRVPEPANHDLAYWASPRSSAGASR